jgi:hypothetical protein
MNPDMYTQDMYEAAAVEPTPKIEDKSKPVYYINEEKRIVVCVLNFDIYKLDWLERKALMKLVPSDVSHRDHLVVRGIAKCNPSDTFDIEFGKRLAWVRAHRKYHKLMMQAEAQAMDSYAKEVIRYLKKHTSRASKIEGLVKKEEVLVAATEK